MTAARSVLRVVGVVLAVAVLLVLGVPALLGWVPLPVDDDASGVPAGSLVVVEPVDPSTEVAAGDVVTVVTSSGSLITRTVHGTDATSLTLSAGGDNTSQVDRQHLRAVERYRLPLLGQLVGAVPAAHRPWWARALGALFLVWAASEVWAALRRRKDEEGEQAAVVTPASRRPQTGGSTAVAIRDTTAPAMAPRTTGRRRPHAGAARTYGTGDPTAGAAPSPTTTADSAARQVDPPPADHSDLPTRRERARARRRSPWNRLTDMAASAVGAVVMATRTFDRRHEDPAEGGGRHRNPMPATSVDTSHIATTEPGPPGPAVPGAPGGTPQATGHGHAADTSHGDNLWGQRISKEEAARTALIQDFEARRAAAEATLLHGVRNPRGGAADASPIDRLLREREAGRKRPDDGDGAS